MFSPFGPYIIKKKDVQPTNRKRHFFYLKEMSYLPSLLTTFFHRPKIRLSELSNFHRFISVALINHITKIRERSVFLLKGVLIAVQIS